MGATSTKIGLVDERGNVSNRISVKTNEYQDINEYVDALYKVLEPVIEKAGGKKIIKGIGAGVPNGNFYTGQIVNAANLPWKGVVPFAKLMSDKFGLKCVITNDANAAALGEMTYGVAKGMRDFIMITLGTGVGGGVVINGQLVYGFDGFAGELGHVIIERHNGRACGCGRHGCLETYTSATGVAMTAREFLQKTNEYSLLRSFPLEKITSKEVFDAAQKGDPVAQEVFAYTGKLLGEAFADFAAFSAPEAVILFGGLTKAGDMLINPIQKSMDENLLPVWKGKIKLILSQLPDDDAAILGAASLIATR